MVGFVCGQTTEKKVPVFESSQEELQRRVDTLEEDETYVFEFLKRCYSRRWITETLFISRAQLGNIERRLYRKLGVLGLRPMIRIYSQLQNSQFRLPGSIDVIDDYVERRSEAEIKAELNNEGL